MTEITQITPNVVISDPGTRRQAGVVLYVLLILAGLASLLLAFFPEVNIGEDIIGRAVNFVTAAVTFLAAAFGLGVTTPNVPRGRYAA